MSSFKPIFFSTIILFISFLYMHRNDDTGNLKDSVMEWAGFNDPDPYTDSDVVVIESITICEIACGYDRFDDNLVEFNEPVLTLDEWDEADPEKVLEFENESLDVIDYFN